jgi:hypothetical protein
MNRRILLLGGFPALLLPVAGLVRAEPARKVQAEVDALLAGIESSGCSFYRNGTWHGSKEAVAHLREKYDYLVARDLIATTEDFIERAASRSSFSGQPYQVKCGDGVAVASNRWLRDRLAQLRPH